MIEINNKEQGKKIVIKETPEMANWMHPQTEERKKLIEKRTKELIDRRIINNKKLDNN